MTDISKITSWVPSQQRPTCHPSQTVDRLRHTQPSLESGGGNLGDGYASSNIPIYTHECVCAKMGLSTVVNQLCDSMGGAQARAWAWSLHTSTYAAVRGGPTYRVSRQQINELVGQKSYVRTAELFALAASVSSKKWLG